MQYRYFVMVFYVDGILFIILDKGLSSLTK